MSFNGGFFGKLLRIDLTDRNSSVEDIDGSTLKDYVGGALLAARILYDELEPGRDPLGPENKLVYAVGPLTGTSVPCSSRLNIGTRSPLTGGLASSLSGGFFPVEMKKAGYDVIVIEGKADSPVYISINNDRVRIRSAERIWGLDSQDTQMYLKEELKDQNFRISCIGPAGENLSCISCIMNEARAAGRKGVGAVMGSKNLKAIAVRGTCEVPVADQSALRAMVIEIMHLFKKDEATYGGLSRYGTTATVESTIELGVFPENNWQKSADTNWAKKAGSQVLEAYNVRQNPCYGCPIGCSWVRMNRHGRYAGLSSEGPEYETIYSLGSSEGINDPEYLIAADRLCDRLGLDTISAGLVTSMAMELVEKGILEDTGGLDLRFGNQKESLEFLRMLAYREGFADNFADGTRKAAERLGGGTDLYAIEVKGLELPAYDARGLKAMGLNFATSYTGADHNRGYAIQEVFGVSLPEPVERLEIKGKGRLTKWNQDFCGAFDVPTLCMFPIHGPLLEKSHDIVAKLLTSVTGLNFEAEDVWTLGERLNNLARMFNVREGFSRFDDYLPRRVMEEPLKNGLSEGEYISRKDLDQMLDEYYEARVWDSQGIPKAEKLSELGLDFTIKDIPDKDGGN
jgi:aldehyde:ferredoxin oxidoreductase